MSESVAMMFYIAQKYGPTETLPPVDDERFAKVLQFTLLGEASLSSLMTPLLAARFGAPDDQKRNWSAVGIEARLKSTIDRLDDEIGNREFWVGPNLTLADISVATALRIWTRGVGQDLPVTLKAYGERLEGRPACKRAMAASIASSLAAEQRGPLARHELIRPPRVRPRQACNASRTFRLN